LLEIDPQDALHLFWEEMKRIFFAMREVKLEDLEEETRTSLWLRWTGSQKFFTASRRGVKVGKEA
jgi:hypothetical protein